MSGPRIFVVGSYMHAFVMRTARFPRDGETVFGTDAEIGPGGKGSNQAIGMSRLGAHVDMLACVGEDVFGEYARKLWEAEGIEGRWIHVRGASPTGMASILVDGQGQNRIVVFPGANGLLDPRDVDDAEEAIAAADVLVAQFESPKNVVEQALEVARRHGVMTILNPAPALDVSDHLLSLVDTATPNEEEARELAGFGEGTFTPAEAAGRLRARGVGSVVLTLGSAGACLVDSSGARVVDGLRVPVVDTTGAGDAFTAALAVGLASGRSIDEAVAFANRGGAYCVTQPGVVPGLGDHSALRDLDELRAADVPSGGDGA